MSQTGFLVVVAIILALICCGRLLMARWGFDDWTILDGVLVIGCIVGSYIVTADFFDGADCFFNADLSFYIFGSLIVCLLWILLIYIEKGLLIGKSGIFMYIIIFIHIWISVFSLTEDVYSQKEIQVAQECISSGWEVYKDGERINTKATKSINFNEYEIEFNYDDESIYLIPQKGRN